MADPDEALIEAIAANLVASVREYTGLPDADVMWNFSIVKAAEIQAAVLVAHLGLVEEWERWCGGWKPTTAGAAELFREKGSVPSQRQTRRRLVSRWTEVDHGSE